MLLQAVGEQLADREAWTAISLARLQAKLSFWSIEHISNLIGKLVTLGILQQRPSQTPGSILLSASAEASAPAGGVSSPPAEPEPTEGGKWQPSAALEDLIALTHGIPRHFIASIATQFVETPGSEIDTQFRQLVLSRWREAQESEAKAERSQAFEVSVPPPFGRDWVPSQDALDILAQAASTLFSPSRCRIYPYWVNVVARLQRGQQPFVEHVRRRWLKHTSQLHHSTEPTRIPRNWQPDICLRDTRLAGLQSQRPRHCCLNL